MPSSDLSRALISGHRRVLLPQEGDSTPSRVSGALAPDNPSGEVAPGKARTSCALEECVSR